MAICIDGATQTVRVQSVKLPTRRLRGPGYESASSYNLEPKEPRINEDYFDAAAIDRELHGASRRLYVGRGWWRLRT
jgi:hypothetical protein